MLQRQGIGVWETPRQEDLQLAFRKATGGSSRGPSSKGSKLVLPGGGSAPQSVSNLDYWQAIEFFDNFNIFKNGIDKKYFYKMMLAICRDRERMSRRQADAFFETIDLDGSGIIDREEFLGWCFDTHSNYCGNVRKRLSAMNPERALVYYRMIDKDGNGELDKDEFYQFILKFSPEGDFSREATDHLFDFIDADKSGAIDINEFLEWVFPERKMQRLALMPEPEDGKKMSKKEEKKAALFEMPPNQPVVLEFTTGPGFEMTLYSVEKILRRKFDEKAVKFRYRLKMDIQGCEKLVVCVGRGIVLWDRNYMLPFMANPFENMTSSRHWVEGILLDCLPDLIRASRPSRRSSSRGGGSNSRPQSRAQSHSRPGTKEAPRQMTEALPPGLPRPASQGALRRPKVAFT